MPRSLLRFLQRPPEPIPQHLWHQARQRLPWLARLDAERDARLAALAALFLQRKTITALSGLVLSDEDRVILAALCCLPLLEFGAEGLHGWSQVLVYPDAFRAHRSHVDAAGVMHEWDDELIGEAWEHGPLVLSWADVCEDMTEPDAGYCVAVHEMAHKLDALDGLLDGTPPLPRDWQRLWARDFQQAFDAFAAAVERGEETGIDPYAAEAPEEFFAVCSEYHFSDPAALQAQMPQVAAHLARLYGASPFAAATTRQERPTGDD
jgi:Mlc titration factor MtfA (ptsG expression regulator)